MGILANATVDIGANLAPLRSGLSEARRALSAFAGGTNVKLPLTIAMGAGGASLGGLIAGLGDAAVKAAKLQEALAKVKVTFGEEAGGILANVDELADKFGVTKRQAADAAAEFGLLAKAAGMSSYEQARFAKEFNQIAIDLASFHVTSRPEAVQKLMSGLEGMVRPLRQFGIFIDEAKVKAEASALGIRKHNEELTDEQKILVRSILIRKQAGIALGDAERSMARPFEQMKKFWGDLENAQAEFGKNLQGALIQGIGLARDLGTAIQGWGGKAGITGSTIGETAESALRAGRAMAGPGRGGVFGNLWQQWVLRMKAGLQPLIGADTPEARAKNLRELRALQGEGVAATIRATEPGLAGRMGPATPEELRKMFLKAAEGMDPEVRKAGADFVFKVQNKLTDWIALHLKGATDPFGEFKANMEGISRAIRPMLLGEPAGGLLRGAGAAAEVFGRKEGPAFEKMRRNRALELLGLKKRQPSQMFAEPEEFARHAITGVLSPEPQKQQVKLLEDTRDELKEIKGKVVEAVAQFGKRWGLFPRGG